MNYQQLLDAMLAYEIDPDSPRDGRRVIRDQRQILMASRRRDATGRLAAERKAAEVLSLWA